MSPVGISLVLMMKLIFKNLKLFRALSSEYYRRSSWVIFFLIRYAYEVIHLFTHPIVIEGLLSSSTLTGTNYAYHCEQNTYCFHGV